MRTLYQITEDLKALDNLLEENGGDITAPGAEEIIAEWMSTLDGDISRKVNNYCCYIRELEAMADGRKAEAERLNKAAQHNLNAAARMKEALKERLQAIGRDKVVTDLFAVSVCNNGGALPMDVDEASVPDDYKVMVPKVDTSKIRTALTTGIKLTFARLLARGTHLRIR